MGRVRRLTLAPCLLGVLPATAAAAVPVLHAERGAHTAYGRPEFGENTLSAFRAGLPRRGAPSSRSTRGSRATGCRSRSTTRRSTARRTAAGLVADRTLAELAACRVDTIGSPGSPLGAAVAVCPEAIPTIAEVLADARDAGATVTVDAGAAAGAVMDVVLASGLPKERLIVRVLHARGPRHRQGAAAGRARPLW